MGWKLYIALLIGGLAGMAPAQELEISGSPSPVGSGARAAGMADAFVAIADDATAASWNPAGLVQLERPELSIVGSWNGVYETFDAIGHPEFSESHHAQNLDLNYLSVAYPLPFLFLGRNNMVVSLNYQRKYDFSREFNATLNEYGEFTRLRQLEFKQSGGLSAISPAIALELTKHLSAGLSLNLWRSSILSENSWRQTTKRTTLNFAGNNVSIKRVEDYEDFEGENVTLGLLWSPNDRWNFGARYDSAFTGSVDYRIRGFDARYPFNRFSAIRRGEKRELRLPATLAVGAARRFGDRLTLSLDVSRTDWKDFWVKDKSGNHYSLVNFGNFNDILAPPTFDPTYTVRFGGEYVFLPPPGMEYTRLARLWSLRAGVFFDQEPASGKAKQGISFFNRGDGEPETFYGVALGAGLLANQRVNIDVAYQLRYGPGVNQDFIRGLAGFEEDVIQHRILLSTVIYF